VRSLAKTLRDRLKNIALELWSSILAAVGIQLTDGELNRYLNETRKRHETTFYIKRHFSTQEDWSQLASFEYHRRHGVLRDLQPDLSKILQNSKIVILGEPGAGKSAEAHAVVRELLSAAKIEFIPIFCELRAFRGDIREFLGATATRRRLLDASRLSSKSLRRIYILDGLDEVPSEFVPRLSAEINSLFESDQNAHLVLTSRQAFYESRRERFGDCAEEFYLLDFTDDDIRSFTEHLGINYDQFWAEVRRVDFEEPISNPFTLDSALKYFGREGRLGNLRSEIVAHVIGDLIASRPQFVDYQQRRALHMLAVGLEIYSRNEITVEEAMQILHESMKLGPGQAERLLEELSNSILIRVADKISFQTRSYGEYLAAEELRDAPLDRVQELLFFPETRIPNQSWRNTISYLVELNKEVRRFFLSVHPKWVVGASPAAFSVAQRTELVGNIFQELASDEIYLVVHPTINIRYLARFATQENKDFLLREHESNQPVRAGNAFALLAHMDTTEPVEEAFQVVASLRNNHLLRRSALVALANLGDRSLVPRLFEILDMEDPFHLSILDAIGALMQEQDIPVVLPVLVRTNAMVSSAFFRFRRFTSREALEQVLKYLVDNPRLVEEMRIDSYIEPIWNLIRIHWDDDIAGKLAHLLLIWERSGVHEQRIGTLRKLVRAICERDVEGKVVRIFLRELLDNGHYPINFPRTTTSFLTVDVARWLVDLRPPAEFLKRLAIYSRETIRNILLPRLPESEAVHPCDIEDQERRDTFMEEIGQKQKTIESSRDY